MTKNKNKVSQLLNNNKFVFAISLLSAIIIWFAVVINVSPETERTITDVKVTIDKSVPSQFDLEVFGDAEFYVDVTVVGKKHQISSGNLSADDIIVSAITSNVDSAGLRTLSLKAEPASGSADYKISSLSQKSVDVYFDVPKTIQMVIEPEVVTDNFEIVKDGFKTGDINLSETELTVSGPATEVNKIERAVAKLVLTESLSSNKSANAEILLLDEKNNSNFDFVKTNINSVVLTIPVLQVKEVKTSVLFKNAPDEYVLNPLAFSVSPSTDFFNISVDEYEKTTEFLVGTIDFKSISPSNYVFEFMSTDLPVADESDTENFIVKIDASSLSQDYFVIPGEKVKVNNPDNLKFNVSGLNKSVMIVGSEKALENVTEDDITVEIDISALNISQGQTVTLPANVTIKSTNCWVYGTYTVEVSL